MNIEYKSPIEDDLTKIKEEDRQYGRRSFTGYCRGYYDLPIGHRLVFVTMTSSGLKLEGNPVTAYYATRECAEDALDQAIREYIKDKEGHIHWRMKPDTQSEVFYREDFDSLQPRVKEKRLVLAPTYLWCAFARIAVDPFVPVIGG